MPVRLLELENFKSYAGRQVIGPFTDFTSVIGPNGSGKSNLMDAVSFVLGVHSKDLRSKYLNDLVYRSPGTAEREKHLKCSATLVYDTPTGEEIRFSRNIIASGLSDYKVNGESISRAGYEKALADIGVLVKARNFLVFQGDVENLAHKSPIELVDLLETISGSAEYKIEYEAAFASKEEAENARLFCSKQKKTFEQERHALKDQKEEAERFHDLLMQKAKTQTDFYLWLIFQLDQERIQRESATYDLAKNIGEFVSEEQETSAALKEAKKSASTSRRQTAVADRIRVAAASEVDTTDPTIIEVSEEIKNLQKKLKLDEMNLTKMTDEAKKHDTKLEDLDKEILEFQQTKSAVVKEYEETKIRLFADSANSEVHLTAAQEENYERIREAAAAASAEPRRVLSNLNRKLESIRSKIVTKENEFAEALASKDQLERNCEDLESRSSNTEIGLKKTSEELSKKEAELEQVQDTHHELQARREELDIEIESLNSKIRDAKNVSRQNKEEERLLTAIKSLKSNFPGVHGRLVDLCRPTQRKYSQAVTVAAGKDMDAIVVDARGTALECIKYLREHRIGTATFLPLDHLQAPPIESTERLRAQFSNDSRYRLVIDVISIPDPNIKRAVHYAVGNTVVADDLDSARELCFGRQSGGRKYCLEQSRVKAVTLGGAVISKAGTMTGGITRDDDGGAGRWNNQDVQKLQELREKVETVRAGLDKNESDVEGSCHGHRSISHSSKVEELRNAVATLKNRSNFLKGEMKYTRSEFDQKRTLLQSMCDQVAKLKSDIANIENEFEKTNCAIQKVLEDIKVAEDHHMAPFREATGLRDLKAYEEAIGKSRDEFNEKKRALVEHITSLEQKKEYEMGRDLKLPIIRMKGRIKDRKASLKEAVERSKKLQKKVDVAKEKLATAEEALQEATQKEAQAEKDVQVAQATHKEVQNASTHLKKQLISEETALERLRGKLHEVLQKARVEKVELPTIGVGTKSAVVDRTRSHYAREVDEDEPDSIPEQASLDAESLELCGTHESRNFIQFSQPENPVVRRDQQHASNIDFSKLHESMKRPLNDREEKKVRKEFEEKLSKIVNEIESLTPNMKADDAFVMATQRLKDYKTDYEKAKEEATKAAQVFQQIKTKRVERFLEAYNHIENALKTIYTDMTKSSKHPLGGNAFLSLGDMDEPFKGGIKFNAMPPMKRFRDMEQLSGGEKTVAALSLLFAIHSFHPAPFFIMDEVDAALDNINLRKVCNYISQRSKTDFQCIVISLKDMFYEHSQSLVGICRDVETNSSITMTLELTKFDPSGKAISSSIIDRSKRPRDSELTYSPNKRASFTLESPNAPQ